MSPLTTHQCTEESVLAKCEYFTDVQVWPLRKKLRPVEWLGNFDHLEKDYAVHLLDAFMYFNESMIEPMLAAAFQGVGRYLGIMDRPFQVIKSEWNQFCEKALVTRVTGEEPNDTDSGFIFQRLTRQVLGIAENQIQSPEQVLNSLVKTPGKNVIFVDDFVGSGDQFLTTWYREIVGEDRRILSFANISARMPEHYFYYCPLICTRHGWDYIRRNCDSIRICAAHILAPEYNALHPNSFLWPDHLAPTSRAFLEKASQKAGIPSDEWQGYKGLGLALAFAHSVPDATLPLFYWDRGGWKPLIEKT